MDDAELKQRFRFHPADTEEVAGRRARVREAVYGLAVYLDEELADGREKSLVMTKLEEAMLWAELGIVRERLS